MTEQYYSSEMGPPPQQYDFNNVAPSQFFYGESTGASLPASSASARASSVSSSSNPDKGDSFNVNGDNPGLPYNPGQEAYAPQFQQEVYNDPSQDYSWMEGVPGQNMNMNQGHQNGHNQNMNQGNMGHQVQNQGQGHQPQTHHQFLDPQFQQHQSMHQYGQFGQEYDQQAQTQVQGQGQSASPQAQSTSPVSHTASPIPEQQQQVQNHGQSPHVQSPQVQHQSQSPQVQTVQQPPTAGPPPKFINGEEYHFVPGLGYYPVARIPALRQHQQQAQNQPQVQIPVQQKKQPTPKAAKPAPKPKAAPKAPPKKVLSPTAQAAGAVTAQVSLKKRSPTPTEMPEGDFSILEKVASNPAVADIIRETFTQLVDQKDSPNRVAYSACRLLLSVPETEWGKSQPDLMALCLSNCFKAFEGDKDTFHDFWRAMRRYQNFVVRLRAWMVFNVNKRFIEECTHALDFLVVMRLSHDTLLQFKFDKVLKKLIKLGSDSVKAKSNKVLDQAAQTVKADDTSSASPVAVSEKPSGPASSASAVTAAIAAAKAKSGKVTKPAAKPVAKPAAGSFFKSLSKPEVEKKEAKVEDKKKSEVKPEEKKPEAKKPEAKKPEVKPPPSAFNDVMANILRVPTKRASPAASGAPVEAKKQKVKKKVSWRPEETLVDVRYFESEKDENRNHHLSSYRDMDKEEGRGLIGNNSEVDIDFDAVEDEQQEWYEPEKMTFDGVKDDIEPNPPKRGGTGEVESSEAEVMAQKNKTSLATVYGPDDDIPDSPAEPSEASQNPLDLPDSLLTEPKEMVVAERTKKMLGIMSGAYRVVPKVSFKGDPTDENVCEAYDTVFVGESAPEKKPEASEVPAFDISKLPGFASVSASSQDQSTPPPPPPPAAAPNPLAALAALPGLQNLIPALQAAANPSSTATPPAMPPIPGLPPGVDPMAFVQALAQMQQQQQQQQQQQPPQRYNDRYNDRQSQGSVAEMRKRDVRPEIARAWDKLPANRYSQPCRFFNTDKACSRGDQCIFLHLPRN